MGRWKPFPILILTAAILGGCASAGPPPPTPEEIPGLEAAVSADPGDVRMGLRLAAGYRAAGRIGAARALVSRLRESSPEDAALLAMSGLLAEDAEDLAAARTAYGAALATGRAGALEGELRARLESVRRAELRASVAAALAREDEIAQANPDPATIGVFPFVFEGVDPTWEPLALALPEMLATDLAVTGRLQVLERIHVNALVQELGLADAGRVDPATAARGGRLLGSGNIVQGTVRVPDDARIGVDAALVAVRGRGAEEVDPLSVEDVIARVFAVEKELALDLHAELGIALTPAERAQITELQTESVQALLELGRGIAAENSGDYIEARRHYAAAETLDPEFTLATERRRSVDAVSVEVPTSSFAAAAQTIATQRQAVDLLRNAPTVATGRAPEELGVEERAVISEVLGHDRIGQTTLLELIFRGPGGSP